MHPDFEHLDPSGLENPDKDQVKKEKMFKPIDVGNIDELREKTKKMDIYQKFVIEVAVKFARGIIKAMKPKNRKPIPPMLMVHGGAGSGKSTVISVIARWAHHILQRPVLM
jgi:pantothenate kinase-related protein Tda10